LTSDQTLNLFKFYEEAADKAKAHAWAQTTWVLTLNAAILGFSVNYFASNAGKPAFFAIELLSSAVGIVLCGFLLYLLTELGGHISHYWASSNRIAAGYAALVPFVGESNARAALASDYRVPFPAFCRRLQYLVALFIVAHLGWLVFIAYACRA
jgi:hypothetical protein